MRTETVAVIASFGPIMLAAIAALWSLATKLATITNAISSLTIRQAELTKAVDDLRGLVQSLLERERR